MKQVKKRDRTIVIALCALLLISNSAWFINRQQVSDTKQSSTIETGKNYPYLAKRVFSEHPNDTLINFAPLRKDLEAKFSALDANTERSFYFEYLPTGTSIRIGADDELVAASLIKVPLVMNLYKAAELGKIDLDKKIKITPEDLDSAYGSLWQKGAGTTITLREAAKLTLTESDNTASHAIFNHLDGLLDEQDQSLARLDIDQNLQNDQAVINARSYTSVLKGLYFSSYVQREGSQEILEYLTHSNENRRLTAKLPKDLKVAHKNGVFNVKWAESDCGIVYVTKRPYAICVMVSLPEDQANAFIADISKQVYDFVISR